MIFVDFSPLNRIKAFDAQYHDFLLSHQIVIIDHHHESNPLDIAVYHKDTTSIATCEIITERVKKYSPDLVDAQTATALLMGIMTDSGNFLFPCDYQRTFANVLWLMERGADKELLVSKLFRSRSWGSVQFLQVVLQRAILRVPFAWTWIHNNERDRFEIDKQEAKSGMNMIQ
jgi:phosphoesterase RecJ-like protein